MTTKKPLSWFLTDKGRRFSYAVIASTGIGFSIAKFFPHTFLGKYKDFVHYYQNGKPVEVPNDLFKQYEKCLDLLNLSNIHRKLVQPFSVFGYDLFHAGSSSSKYGTLVGIPVNFTYKSLEDVEKQDMQVNGKKVDLTTEIGKKLGNAVLFPEKVKEFAICREILMTLNSKVMIQSSFPFISVFFVYNLSHYLNRRLNLYAAPVGARVVLYTLLGLFGMGSYCLMQDLTEVHYETIADKRLCELGPDYIESGVIFYEKLLQRNQALRELMGKEGERKYTKMGNENYGIRQPHLALIHRKQFFDFKLKEARKTLNSESEEFSEEILES